MGRNVRIVVVLLLAVAAAEFAVLTGVAGGLAGSVQRAAPEPERVFAGVPDTSTPTYTSTPTATPTPPSSPPPSSPPPATGTASISGTITEANAAPIANADVIAESDPCCSFYGAVSDGSGGYTLNGLPAGSYRVRASASGYPSRYHGNTYAYYDATIVVVGDGQAAMDIDVTLELAGSISGILRDDPSLAPLTSGVIYASPVGSGGTSRYAFPAGDGAYTITELAPGAYHVYATSPGHAPEYYDNVYDESDAAIVVVVSGQNTPDIDLALGTGGAISGVVSGPGGVPIANLNVYGFRDQCCGSGYSTTAADGSYTLSGLAPGSYEVQAYGTGYARKYYDNVYDYQDATAVNVTIGVTTQDIDFSLDPAASISGTIRDLNGTPIEGAFVRGSSAQCCISGDSTYTSAGGTYTLTGLAPVPHNVSAEASGFATRFYDGTYNSQLATDIPLSAGATVSGIDISLAPGAKIRGTVRDTNGAPIAGAFVSASTVTCCASGFAISAIDGTYEIGGLAPGSYRVRAGEAGYLDEYYDNTEDFSAATPVNVPEGGEANGIDFSLTLGGTITGVVTDGNGQPIPNIELYAEGDTCCGYGYASTAGNGTFAITGLPTGQYRVRAYGGGYIQEYFDDAIDYAAATLVGATEGETTSDVNFALQKGSVIRGVITDTNGQPIPGVSVQAEDDVCCWYEYGYTNSQGEYEITGLRAGSYRVFADTSGYAGRYYDNDYNYDDALLVPVVPPAEVKGIDITLEPGSSISGVVLDQSSAPLDTAYVEAFQDQCCFVGETSVQADGSYTIDDLPPGSYRVFASAQGYRSEYFDDVTSPNLATLVGVAGGNDTPNIDFGLRLLNPDFYEEAGRFGPLPYTDIRSTAGFGLDNGENIPCGSMGATAWYRFDYVATPPLAGLFQVDTLGSNFDTVIAVYQGAPSSPPGGLPGAAQLVGCNDNSGGGSQSVFTFTPTQGPYFIQVGGKNGATGTLQFHADCVSDNDCDTVTNATDNCVNAWNQDQLNSDNLPLVTAGIAQPDTSIARSDANGDACDIDDDNDGISDEAEATLDFTSPPNVCADLTSGTTDSLNPDTDDDLVRDGAECLLGSDPTDPNSKPSVGGPDSDGDGLSNAFEGAIGSNPNNVDSDGDGVNDGVELKGYSTSPTNVQSDSDGCADDREIASVDDSSAVNSLDLLLVAQQFLKPGKPVFDINKDGSINVLDLQLVARNFNPVAC